MYGLGQLLNRGLRYERCEPLLVEERALDTCRTYHLSRNRSPPCQRSDRKKNDFRSYSPVLCQHIRRINSPWVVEAAVSTLEDWESVPTRR